MTRENQIKSLIECYEKEYKEFMGIEKFPEYELELYKEQIGKVCSYGFGTLAEAKYNPKTDKHLLRICISYEINKYVIFHEFTHILDAEMYAKKDSNKYLYVTGYTEYHASQVELMALLGVKKVFPNEFTFSINSVIDVYPNACTIKNYLLSKHQFVVDMMSRMDYSANIEILKPTISLLYNYFGLRSICKMYAKDYEECVDNTAIIKILSLQLFSELNIFMNGQFDEKKIELSFVPYSNVIFSLVEKYNLS